MIKIEINYDIIIKVSEVGKIDGYVAGIYVLLDEKNTPIYIG